LGERDRRKNTTRDWGNIVMEKMQGVEMAHSLQKNGGENHEIEYCHAALGNHFSISEREGQGEPANVFPLMAPERN